MNKLFKLRAERGLTQQQFAKMLDIAVSTYNQYEKGERNIPAKIVNKIANLFNLACDNIFLPIKFTISK